MNELTFNCPHCQQSLEASEELFGQGIDCPACGRSLNVPSAQNQQPHKQCPNCLADIHEEAVLCVKCGFNLKTGKIMRGAAYPTQGSTRGMVNATQSSSEKTEPRGAGRFVVREPAVNATHWPLAFVRAHPGVLVAFAALCFAAAIPVWPCSTCWAITRAAKAKYGADSIRPGTTINCGSCDGKRVSLLSWIPRVASTWQGIVIISLAGVFVSYHVVKARNSRHA